MKIMITGPQGSGKTTQAKIIAQKYGLLFIGLGDEMRKLAEEESADGIEVKVALDRGGLVPDRIAAETMKKIIDQPKAGNGFVTDGYPRTIDQVSLFDPEFDTVFYLKVPDEVVEERLLARGRVDDTPELIRQRLSWYHQETEPLLDYYRKQEKLVVVNGRQEIGEVAEAIARNLKNEG